MLYANRFFVQFNESVCRFTYDENDMIENIECFNTAAFKQMYQEKFVPDHDFEDLYWLKKDDKKYKVKSFAEVYLGSLMKRRVNGIGLYPQGCGNFLRRRLARGDSSNWRRGIDARAPREPPGEHRAASVLCARISCARSSASRTQGPPRTPGALCVAAAVIQTLRRRLAHKNTSCSILVIKSLLD